jgi:hypothetical protein
MVNTIGLGAQFRPSCSNPVVTLTLFLFAPRNCCVLSSVKRGFEVECQFSKFSHLCVGEPWPCPLNPYPIAECNS